MKIAIVGLGKMGLAIKNIVLDRGHEVVTIDPNNPNADYKEICEESLNGVSAGIEFTAPSVVRENINLFNKYKVNLVVGTTGWYDDINDVKQSVEQSDNGLIYASNFSIGVNVFFKIVSESAKIVNKFEDFDISGIEVHHNKKVDSPSGTAITTANLLLDNIERKTKATYEMIDRQIKPNEVHFASLRAGSVPGSHEVIYDSPAESISVKVAARNREGYALGSVIAAEWISNKKGFFSFEQVIDEILGDKNEI